MPMEELRFASVFFMYFARPLLFAHSIDGWGWRNDDGSDGPSESQVDARCAGFGFRCREGRYWNEMRAYRRKEHVDDEEQVTDGAVRDGQRGIFLTMDQHGEAL